jgi:hypothetical protein
MDDQFYRCGGCVGRIPHGAKPSDLPIHWPEKFDLVINLKTAERVGPFLTRLRHDALLGCARSLRASIPASNHDLPARAASSPGRTQEISPVKRPKGVS